MENWQDYSYLIKGLDGEKEYNYDNFHLCLLQVLSFASEEEFKKELDSILDKFIDKRGIAYPASYIIERDEPEKYMEQYQEYLKNKAFDLIKQLNSGETITLNNTQFRIVKK